MMIFCHALPVLLTYWLIHGWLEEICFKLGLIKLGKIKMGPNRLNLNKEV
jgi:hypothetical protein